MQKKKLLISFSGGRTSAYMTWWLLNEWQDRDNWEIIVVFANTGKEHEKTLEFVERCSIEWSINIVWVESVPVSVKGWGVTHNIVDYLTASRNGEPFELMISKLGIPNQNAPFCSDQLKRSPIESYLKSIEWKDYYKALGIRADEIDRINPKWRKNKILYPFIQYYPVNKMMVNKWWGQQPFNLILPERLGNCDNCFKKSIKKLTQNAIHNPTSFDWWQRITDNYTYFTPRDLCSVGNVNFYRGNLSPKDIFKLAKLEQSQLELFVENERLDGCSESCEAFQ